MERRGVSAVSNLMNKANPINILNTAAKIVLLVFLECHERIV